MDITEIRNYNKEVQTYQSKASELLASKDYRQKELDKLCKELTELTGRQVTPDTLETVYTEMMSQFQQTLNTGREIINRAKAEEQSLNVVNTSGVGAGQSGSTGAGTVGVGTGQTGNAGAGTVGVGTGQTGNAGFGSGFGFNGFAQMGGGLPGVPPMNGAGQMGTFGQYDSHGTVTQI